MYTASILHHLGVVKMLSRKIIKLRDYIQITQQELGEILGVSKGQISHYETGKRIPSIACAAILMLLGEKYGIEFYMKDFLKEK